MRLSELAALGAEAFHEQALEAQRQGDEREGAGAMNSALSHYKSAALLLHLSGAMILLSNKLAAADVQAPPREPIPDGPHLTDEEGWRDQQRERRVIP